MSHPNLHCPVQKQQRPAFSNFSSSSTQCKLQHPLRLIALLERTPTFRGIVPAKPATSDGYTLAI
eukprot:m.45076 g.45076  ORF g.45076 m.45076 type:complete len:65 (+) comp11754_c0_seq1:340-534(+)